MTHYQPLGLSPSPDSNPLKTTPMTTPGELPGKPLRQPLAITAHHCHQPLPPPASPLAITAMTITSALALAITPPVTTTSALAPI
ncbi:hypothetical protein C0993_001400, partial [Termitomyces sp. T159_Od127]